MEESSAVLPVTSDAAAPLIDAPSIKAVSRWFAILQVVVISGIPTQLAVVIILIFGAGMRLPVGNDVSLEFFALLGLIDTALVALLIRWFLFLSRETSSDVFIGRRPAGGEIIRGLLLVPATFIGMVAVILIIRTAAPWMQTFERSPLEAFLGSPFEAAIFGFVAVLAGGVREELQRAFVLHRFDQAIYFRIGRFSVGGIRFGLVVFSLFFALMHVDQGLDAALAIGLLGVFWGILYIKRRSAVLSMVNHAGFNAIQVVQHVLLKAFVPGA